MAQITSTAVQARIQELLRKMQEKEEERKKKSQEIQAEEDAVRQWEKEKDQTPSQDNMTPEASSSQITAEAEVGLKEVTTGHLTKKSQSTIQRVEDTIQKTITVWSKAGWTTTLERVDESMSWEKLDDKSGKERPEIDVGDGNKDQEGSNDEASEKEPIVNFEDPLYKLSQSYEIESEYEDMTIKQEAVEVRTLTPREQAKYRELKQFHQHQVHLTKKKTGISTIIKERTHAKTPGIPTDLIRRHVWEEPLERQEMEKMTER